MDARAVGLILLWLGVILLLAVLVDRLRKGAWSEQAFEQAPPLSGWSIALASTGLGLAAIGGGLTVWSLR